MKNITDITLDDVKAWMKAKGYKIFTANGVPNIVGIRNVIKETNQFIDKCHVWWTENGKEQSHVYTITTRPGKHYLENPINDKGAGILVPGQYLNIWELGMHRGKQFALCQRGGSVKVYRDNNKNDIIDIVPGSIDEGWFGIDGHHAGEDDADEIGYYSAGCQVWRFHGAHNSLMNQFNSFSKKYNFKRFSYTLLLQEDFKD